MLSEVEIVRRHIVFALYAAAIALLHADALAALFRYSQANVAASHIALVPLVSIFLIQQRRAAVFAAPAWAPLSGAALAAAGLLLRLAASGSGPLPAARGSFALSIAGIVVLWGAGFVAAYGVRAARAAAFPLLFLAFVIPVPEPVLAATIFVLKKGTAELLAGLFTLTGTTYFRQEFTFAVRDFVIVVADECSGIRSTIALVMTTLLAGHMFLRSSWRKGVLVLCVLPITMLKNAVRIAALTLLAMHVNPSFLTGTLHRDGGFAFFLLALVMLSPVLFFLRRSESAPRALPGVRAVSSSSGAAL